MPVADKISALFAALTEAEVLALPPAERRRFADVCRYWAERADPPKPAVTIQTPKSNGVLALLARGERAWP